MDVLLEEKKTVGELTDRCITERLRSSYMTKQDLLQTIEKVVNRMAQAKGSRMVTISEDTRMLGGDLDMDSLDLAALVVELEAATNKDPFKEGFVNFRTAGELADLYAQL